MLAVHGNLTEVQDSSPHVAEPVRASADADARLIARVAAGDDTALAALYDTYSPIVYGLAKRIGGSVTIAEEVTQEVFLYVWNNPDRYDSTRGTMRAFLGALTHRRSVDVVRRETRREVREERVSHDPSGAAEVIDLSERIASRELAKRVRMAVGSLPPEQREAVELAYFGGCTFKDVAVRLGIPEGTAKSRLRLALGKLSSMLAMEVAPA